MAVRDPSGEHPREKIMKIDKKNDKKVYLVAQELKLARVLAGNNKTSRDRALKSLKKWFAHRSKTFPFTDNDLQVIWKGLYYSMWMSDKPLVQEECAESIASLIHFETIDESLLFFKAGLTILINEWFGIDQLRLDKFLMLVRRLLRQMLVALKRHGLSESNVGKFGEILSFTILNTDIHPPVGLFMHFTEIYLEEIAKITKGNMPSERLVGFIEPFIKKLIVTSDGREIAHIKKFIFHYLMKQSDLGIEYQMKYNAWKKVGFSGTIDAIQKVKLDDEEREPKSKNINRGRNEEKPLDPRAGRVNVDLPQIKFKAKDVASALAKYKFSKDSNSKSRKFLTELFDQFTKMSKGVYPLGVKKVLDIDKDGYDANIRKAVNRLVKFEKKLMAKEKKRKRSSQTVEEEEAEKTPAKLRKIISDEENNIDEEEDNDKSEVTEAELQKFIAQSEGNLNGKKLKKIKNVDKQQKNGKAETIDTIQQEESETKLKRKRKGDHNAEKVVKKKKKNKEKPKDVIDNIECVFERNSGTWVVFDLSTKKEDVEAPSTAVETEVSAVIDVKESPSIASNNPGNSESAMQAKKSPSTSGLDLGSPNNENNTPSTSKASPQRNYASEQGSPKLGLSPVRLFESPQKSKELFPKSAWDEPLQEGEYEICIPTKKHVSKLKRKAKKTNQDLHELINTSMKQIKGKRLLSTQSSLAKNPFSTPSSAKKVKINTKLNKSQEIHEHVQQILSSPGIPYDANKKPSKPLLKASACSTPVNPFYNKQLNVW